MKSLKVFLSLLLVSTMLFGCTKKEDGATGSKIKIDTFYDDYGEYTKYLEKTEFDTNDFEYEWLDTEDGQYRAYLYNYSDDIFASGDFNIYDTAMAKDPLTTIAVGLIRPGDYNYGDITSDEFGEYFDVTNVVAYKFNYDAPIDYTFIPDYIADNSVNDIMYDGTYTLDDVKAVAKREYIMNILSGLEIEYNYFFDETYESDPEYPDYPTYDSAKYIAKYDYAGKTISIIEGYDLNGNVVDTFEMK